MKIGIIGGGFMGMTLASRLAERGHAVTVLERDHQLGGLATYHDYGPFVWDRFYHCILPSDSHLIGLLKDVGLGDGGQVAGVTWRGESLRGFARGAGHRFGSATTASISTSAPRGSAATPMVTRAGGSLGKNFP